MRLPIRSARCRIVARCARLQRAMQTQLLAYVALSRASLSPVLTVEVYVALTSTLV